MNKPSTVGESERNPVAGPLAEMGTVSTAWAVIPPESEGGAHLFILALAGVPEFG